MSVCVDLVEHNIRKMALSKQQKKKLTEYRKWVKVQRRRYRIGSYPTFSYALEERQNKLVLCYSVNEVVGYDKKNDEPILKRKKKKKYLDVSLNDYESINVRRHYRLVQKEVKKYENIVQSDAMSLPHWVEEYVSNPIRYGNELSPSSIKSDRAHLIRYIDWLKINSPRHLDIYEHIVDGRNVFEQFLNELRKTKTRYGKYHSKNSLNGYYRRIKGFFNWMNTKDEQFIHNMLRLKGFSQQRNKEKLPPATDEYDMVKFIRYLDENKENKYEKHFIPILRMLLITGCRISEIVSMRIEDVDLNTRTWNFWGKTKRRTIKLDSGTLWEELTPLIFDEKGKVRNDKEWVFHCEYWRKPNKSNGAGGGVKKVLSKHFSSSGVYHKFKKVVKELGLNPKLSPHSCRRGFITYMLEKTNGDVPLVASLVGHSSWEMVHRYNRERLPKERTTIDLGEVLKEN